MMNQLAGFSRRLQDRCHELAGARWTSLQGQSLSERGPALQEDSWQENLSLAFDPARGQKVDPSTLEEAAVAVHAGASGVLKGLRRESTGHSEFTDWEGKMWDVKSPISPPADAQWWVFDPAHQADVVQGEISGDENVLLNLTRCRPADAESLRQTLLSRLQPWETSRVLVLQNP